MSSHLISGTLWFMNTSARPIREIIGHNVREIRDEHGVTADELGRELRHYGMKWNVNRVSELERGQKAVGIPELVTLSLALSSLTGSTTTPGDLLDSGDPVELAEGVTLQNNALRRVVEGDDDLKVGDVVGGVEAVNAAINHSLESLRGISESIPFGQVRQAVRDRGLADHRAARKLGWTDDEFLRHCLDRWGRMLSVETERRAGPDANAQRRGRITRELIDELKGAA